MNESLPILTVADLVNALGGAREVSDLLELASINAVYNWISEGRVPKGWSLTLALECWRRGLWVDPSVLDQPDGAFDVVRPLVVPPPSPSRSSRRAHRAA